MSACPPPPRAAVLGIVGLSLPQAMVALVPARDAALRARLVDAYKAAFHAQRARGAVHEPLYDGIAMLLDDLAADGWRLAVATGKSDRGLALCLAHHRLTDRFVSLQTADRHPSKPHPAMLAQAIADAGATPATTVMIGDTSYDMAMARAAGTRALGVGWGYHTADRLVAAGADDVVDHPSYIRHAIRVADRPAQETA